MEKKINLLFQKDPTTRDLEIHDLIYKSLKLREPTNTEDPGWLYNVIDNKPILSQHWKLKIQLTLQPKNKTSILEKLIDEYCYLDHTTGFYITRTDGDFISKIELDTKEGFEEEGVHRQSRDFLENDDVPIKTRLGILEQSNEEDIFNLTEEFSKSLYITLEVSHYSDIIKDTLFYLRDFEEEEWKWQKI